jgi:hypothetical protein
VFGELLTVFNCSVLSFRVETKFHLNRTLEYVKYFEMDIQFQSRQSYQISVGWCLLTDFL